MTESPLRMTESRLRMTESRPQDDLATRGRRLDRIAERSDVLDVYLHPIAGLEKNGRFASDADAGRRASRDHVPRLVRNAVGDELDDLRDPKDHLARMGVLH